MEQDCEEMGGERLQRTVGEIRFGGVGSITLSSNTAMPLGAAFPSRIVLLVFAFGSTFYNFMYRILPLIVTSYCRGVFL